MSHSDVAPGGRDHDPEEPVGAPHVVILTGPSRAGKTTVCTAVIDAARVLGRSVAGVLTVDGAAADGTALQIVEDLRSGERHLLARARSEHIGASEAGQAALRWAFEAGGVAFGKRALESAAAGGCDLLVVDQLGPLELLHGEGWTGALGVVAAGRFGLALLVVNPRVLDAVRARLDDRSCDVVVVDPRGRDELPAALVTKYLMAS